MVLAVGFLPAEFGLVQLGSACVGVGCDEPVDVWAALMFSKLSWFIELSLYGPMAELAFPVCLPRAQGPPISTLKNEVKSGPGHNSGENARIFESFFGPRGKGETANYTKDTKKTGGAGGARQAGEPFFPLLS
jgi:hypothetical protein